MSTPLLSQLLKVLDTPKEDLPLLINEIVSPAVVELYKSKLNGAEFPEITELSLSDLLRNAELNGEINNYRMVKALPQEDGHTELNIIYEVPYQIKHFVVSVRIKDKHKQC